MEQFCIRDGGLYLQPPSSTMPPDIQTGGLHVFRLQKRQESGHRFLRRASLGGEHRHLLCRALVHQPQHPGDRLLQRLRVPGEIREVQPLLPAGQYPLHPLRHVGDQDPQHPRRFPADLPGQPGQGDPRPRRPEGPQEEPQPAEHPRRLRAPRRGRPDHHRRRRHPEGGQLPEPDGTAGDPRPQDHRQRLLRHPLDLRLLDRRGGHQERHPQPQGRRRVHRQLFHRGADGAQVGLDDLCRRDRRRGGQDDRQRGHRRRVSTWRRLPRSAST